MEESPRSAGDGVGILSFSLFFAARQRVRDRGGGMGCFHEFRPGFYVCEDKSQWQFGYLEMEEKGELPSLWLLEKWESWN